MFNANTASLSPGNRLAKRNSVILAITQMLYAINGMAIMTLGGLVGNMLADNNANATLPITFYILGSLLMTIPASLIMGKIGRQNGFLIGITCGVFGCLLACYAIYEKSFGLFCTAIFLNGLYQAFALYYRFAAADTACENFRPKAIAWVLLGGGAAAIVGPELVKSTQDLLQPVFFAGTFFALTFVTMTGYVFLSFLSVPENHSVPENQSARLNETDAPQRKLSEIIKQPRLIVAVCCAVLSYSIMNFMMTATPLAMIICNYSVNDAAGAIQWHALAMFAPSFITGSLIVRFGVERVIITGLCLLLICALIALSGISILQFYSAMVFLGIGWNFSFIGATSMLSECHSKSESSKVQAFNDFVVFGFVALASYMSGFVLNTYGWASVSLIILPLATIALLVIVTYMIFYSPKASVVPAE